MKKWILYLYLCILSAGAYTQEPFFLNLYAGLNGSQVSGDDLAGFNKFGAYGGIGTGQKINSDWAWEVALIYSQKGSYTASRLNTTYKYLLNLNYIDVPVSVRRKVEIIDIEAGPVVSFLANYRENNAFGPVQDPREFKRLEISMFLGLGYNINDRAGVIVRFTNSVIPIREHLSGGRYLWNRGQYNTVVSVAFKMMF